MNTESATGTELASGVATGNGTAPTGELDLKLESLDKLSNIVEGGEQEFESVLPGVMANGMTGVALCRVEKARTRSSLIHTTPVKSPFVTIVSMGPGWQSDYAVGDRVTYSSRMNLSDELTKGGVEWSKNYCWLHEGKVLGRLPRNAEDTSVKLLKRAPLDVEGALSEEQLTGLFEAHKVWEDLSKKFNFDPNDPNFVLKAPELPPKTR